MKLFATQALLDEVSPIPHKEGPRWALHLYLHILLGQPALDRIGAMFGFPFLQHFVIATLGLNHIT